MCIFRRFHPPFPPLYSIDYDDEAKEHTIVFSEDLPVVLFSTLKVDIIETATKTKVPLICLSLKDAKYTLIFSHGNATDCGAMYITYAMLALALKINVVGYDYTGYGASLSYGPFEPSETQTYRDIEAVYEWCLKTGLVKDPATQIILYGQSVGSGPSCYLSALKPVAGFYF
jgi:pimeloyl-ACP methyl ester carboxylesterase